MITLSNGRIKTNLKTPGYHSPKSQKIYMEFWNLFIDETPLVLTLLVSYFLLPLLSLLLLQALFPTRITFLVHHLHLLVHGCAITSHLHLLLLVQAALFTLQNQKTHKFAH